MTKDEMRHGHAPVHVCIVGIPTHDRRQGRRVVDEDLDAFILVPRREERERRVLRRL